MSDDNRIDPPGAPEGIGGAADRVRVLRSPVPPPEAQTLALERLTDALLMIGGIRPATIDALYLALKIAALAAAHGDHPTAVEGVLKGVVQKADAHMATRRPGRPPAA